MITHNIVLSSSARTSLSITRIVTYGKFTYITVAHRLDRFGIGQYQITQQQAVTDTRATMRVDHITDREIFPVLRRYVVGRVIHRHRLAVERHDGLRREHLVGVARHQNMTVAVSGQRDFFIAV